MRRNWFFACLLLLAGCVSTEPPLLQPLPGTSQAAAAAAARQSGTVGAAGKTPPALYSIAPEQRAQAGNGSGLVVSASAEKSGDISLDFVDTDIRAVVEQILGGVLHANYSIDPAVRGTATLHTERPLTRAQALAALQSLLAQNGAALVQNGALYRVVPQAAAAASPGLAGGSGAAGSTVAPLQYASAEELAKVLQPFVGAGGRIVAAPGRNALVIGGDPESRQSLRNLVEAFDINLLAGQSYAILPVQDGDAKDFATALQEALRSAQGGALAGVVRVLPMARINAVLVASAQPKYIDDVRRIYALVERARRSSVRNWSVYYLQNSRSNDTAYVLQQAFTPRNVTAQPTPSGAGPGSVGQVPGGIGGYAGGGFGAGGGVGGIGGARIGGGGIGIGAQSGGLGLGGGLQQGGLGQQGAGGAVLGGAPAQGQPPAAAANPLLGGLEPGGGENAPETMRIIPNPQNNALLIYATPQERDEVEATLRRLDILPLQVRIDAVIAEVTLNDQLQYGTQFFFTSGEFNSVLSTAAAGAVSAGLNTALPAFIFSGQAATGAPLAISALRAITKVNVLSSPQVMVLDNEAARLQVGQLVPFLTQSAQSTLAAGAPIVSSVDYRQTGVIMDVVPRVNSGGLVTLDIGQEVSDVLATQTTPGLNSPTFSQRVIRTRVAVQDGQTVGLAGLIRDSSSENNSGIPWFRRIPVLGALFGTQNNSQTRTELLVLITPRVIHDQRDARALTEDLREELRNAAALPERLRGLPRYSVPDPQARVRRNLGLH